MVVVLSVLLLQGMMFLESVLPRASASPAPMDPNDPNWAHSYGHGHGHYGQPENNPYNYGNYPDHFGNNPDPLNAPPPMRLRLPGTAAYHEEEPMATPRATPRTLNLINALRRHTSRSRDRSSSSQEVPESPRNLPPRPSSRFRESSRDPDSHNFDFGPESSSSSYVPFGAGIQHRQREGSVSTPQSYDYQQGGGSSSSYPYDVGTPQYPSHAQVSQEMTANFDTMNMQDDDDELPIQPDIGHHHQSSVLQRGRIEIQPKVRDTYLLSNRKQLRRKYEADNPTGPIPLRYLTADECIAIGLPRHSMPRYDIALYLEDQYFRSMGFELGPQIAEPEGWQGYNQFKPLVRKHPKQGYSPRLRDTQYYLDNLFETNDVFHHDGRTEEEKQAHNETRRRAGDRPHESDLGAMDRWYQAWTEEHDNFFVPLRYMAKAHLKAMGLTKNGIKYQVAKWAEEQEFIALGHPELCPSVLTVRPEVGVFKDLMLIRNPLEMDTYLYAKQHQIQHLLIKYGFIEQK